MFCTFAGRVFRAAVADASQSQARPGHITRSAVSATSYLVSQSSRRKKIISYRISTFLTTVRIATTVQRLKSEHTRLPTFLASLVQRQNKSKRSKGKLPELHARILCPNKGATLFSTITVVFVGRFL